MNALLIQEILFSIIPKQNKCHNHIGTSGWYYRDWIGTFYPQKLKSYEDLKLYSQTFKTVENNSAFYHMPQKKTIQKWIHATEPDFIFCVKLNQNITHFRALMIKDETKALLESYFSCGSA
ncbi:MAG: DUF72 domain-containing protein [Candidatus Omnitrophica bacterium]|nr:DUF72 domain-containing protein [Candidatus Omnitrophota bacterium]